MRTDTPTSDRRCVARRLILQVIEDNVLGPVQCLPHHDVLLLRRKLRDAYPWGERKYWPYKVWCEEVRAALGYQIKRAKRQRRAKRYRRREIMPSMRAWAEKQGILADEEPESP